MFTIACIVGTKRENIADMVESISLVLCANGDACKATCLQTRQWWACLVFYARQCECTQFFCLP